MQPLSPFDALSPAFTRTSEVLLKPFSWGRSWKLAAMAYLGAAGGAFVPMPLLLLLVPAFVPAAHGEATSVIYVISFVATVLFASLFYLLVRCELVAFEMVITRSRKVAPLWRPVGPRVWPWLGLTLLVGTACTLVMVPFGVAAFRALFANMQGVFINPDPNPSPAAIFNIFRAMAGFYGIIFIVFFVPKFVSILFNDFVLPFYLLEPAPLGRATVLGFRLVQANFGSSVLYLICKFFLFLVGIMAQNLVTQIVMLPFILLVFLLLAFVGAFHGATATGGLLFGVAAFLLIVVFLIAIFYVAIGCTGYVMLLLDSYTAYFVGSRYPKLGNLLQPPPPPPAYPYTPPPPPPGVQREDGPPFPTDPAAI